MRNSLLYSALLAIVIIGCQGRPSDRPPVHINPNMDNQPKFKAQSANPNFADAASMRVPPAGTVARGHLRDDVRYYEGLDPATGQPVLTSPVPAAESGLQRGRERYNIYCSVCHGQTGDGKGIMLQKGFPPPASFHSDLVRNYSDGHYYRALTYGLRNMPAHGAQIKVEDRWLIVNYIRALQRSQHATLADIPEEMRGRIR
ncbi:MAG: cytochrome c [Calditrichaeota bacterium]|nr:cytochrome c [Calditrichota bacterium]